MSSISNTLTDPANTIAYMGVEGANADLACRQSHPYMQTLGVASFEEVFAAVASGQAALGMIPIENSRAGRVAEIHQLLPKTKLHIVGEYFQAIEHSLLAPKSATLTTIKEVYSHPQALLQCREHVQALKLATHSYSNTAAAAADVAKWNDPAKAALASPLAGQLYGLQTLKSHMEDASDNVTVFIVIGREPGHLDWEKCAAKGERLLTTLLYTVRNLPAALYKSLGGFATNNVNIVKLESYIPPGQARGAAQFFLTFEGHPEQPQVHNALEELQFYCEDVITLGVYTADKWRFA